MAFFFSTLLSHVLALCVSTVLVSSLVTLKLSKCISVVFEEESRERPFLNFTHYS